MLSVAPFADSDLAEPVGDSGLLVPGRFLHIPGPNPILVPGASGAWDDGVIEAADAFCDEQTFYLYYHGTGQGKGYRLGVGQSTPPSESPPLSLRGLSRASVTVRCTHGPKAAEGIRIQVLRSDDGSQWKTAEVFENKSRAGQTVQTTFPLKLESRFAKILVANRDPSESLTNLTVAAKLGASD